MKLLLPCILFFLLQTVNAQDHIDAQPVGGKQQLQWFIDQELIYPQLMMDNNVEGLVSFRFDIDEKGHTSRIREVNSPDSSALLETLRIFNLIEWVPATFRGYPANDSKTFEIEFDIKKYKRLCKSRGYTDIINPYEPVDSSLKIFWYRNLDQVPKPVFLEKDMNLAKFIATNLNYPELAVRQNVTGVVKLAFVVETNGKISNLSIDHSVGAGCNEEAIRMLRMLKWMPGIYHEKAVRTRTSLSISFNLDRGKDGLFNPVVKSSYGE
jgi:protein TonB